MQARRCPSPPIIRSLLWSSVLGGRGLDHQRQDQEIVQDSIGPDYTIPPVLLADILFAVRQNMSIEDIIEQFNDEVQRQKLKKVDSIYEAVVQPGAVPGSRPAAATFNMFSFFF